MTISEFAAARARPNTLIAVAYDLKVFFTVIVKQPADITTADVLTFIKAQRAPRRGAGVLRPGGRRARAFRPHDQTPTGQRVRVVRLSHCQGRRRGERQSGASRVGHPAAGRSPGSAWHPVDPCTRGRCRGCWSPAEADAFVAALRTQRDRAMVAAMLLGGLRRCEVLGLRLPDLRPGERRVFVADGKGGRQRIVPISARFFSGGRGLLQHRATPNLKHRNDFRVLKGPRV